MNNESMNNNENYDDRENYEDDKTCQDKDKNRILSVFKLDTISQDKKEKIVIIFLLGVFFLLMASPVSSISQKKGKKSNTNDKRSDATIISTPNEKNVSNNEYLAYLENKLEQTIGGMDGAGKVTVMITLKNGGEKILDKNRPYESDSETSKEEGKEVERENIKSNQETVLVEQDGNTGPIIVKEQYPDIEGVVVLCDGGDDETVSLKIKEAVSALFSIDAHKIVVGKLRGSISNNR